MLIAQTASDLKEVRVATSAYGMHLFGKVLIPESEKYVNYSVLTDLWQRMCADWH
jgi:hypothetical protein